MPWWLVLVEGVVAAFLGLILVIAPGASLVFLVQILGLYLFVAGIFRIVGIFLDASSWGLRPWPGPRWKNPYRGRGRGPTGSKQS